MKKITDHINHFWNRVSRRPHKKGCWVWIGGKQGDGYGVLGFRGAPMLAHRVAYFLANNVSLPPEIQVLHKCDNPACCNPSHLFIGNPAINMQDMWNKNRHIRPVGELNNHAKLTAQDVQRIRDLYSKKLMNQVGLARRYKVSQTNISMVIRRSSWKHV